MFYHIYLKSFRCHEETDEVGSDAPYIFVTTVDLAASINVGGFPVPLPSAEVFRYGPEPWEDEVDGGETHFAPGISQSFWGTGNFDKPFDPKNVIFVVALMENDDGNAEVLRGVVKAEVSASLYLSLNLDRDGKAFKLVNDIRSVLKTPTAIGLNQDDVIGVLELGAEFSPNELDHIAAGHSFTKDLQFRGDGGHYTLTFEFKGREWRSLGGFFPKGAPVSVTTRNPNNLDLFVVGNDGRVYTSWWYNGSDWSGINDNWRSLGGFFPPGAPVSAVARTPDHLDLFVVGNDGRVYTSWWHNGSDWSGINDNWRPIGGFFPKGAPVSAVARTPDHLDLFVVGNDGRVYTSWWHNGSDWSGINDNWRPIGGFFPPGAPVSVTTRNPNNLDLFVVGNDGRVYTSWWYAGSDWSGINDNWRPIGGFFPKGAPVSAVARTPDHLDLFVVGNDGRVYTSWWHNGSDWSGINDNWRPIGGFFP
ncbi:hypothetical protein O8D14_01510, partial [Bacillus toyonensis]|nr:hypothetical protein [Bacillus toyonensis]